jgi:hypothetical protein
MKIMVILKDSISTVTKIIQYLGINLKNMKDRRNL